MLFRSYMCGRLPFFRLLFYFQAPLPAWEAWPGIGGVRVRAGLDNLITPVSHQVAPFRGRVLGEVQILAAVGLIAYKPLTFLFPEPSQPAPLLLPAVGAHWRPCTLGCPPLFKPPGGRGRRRRGSPTNAEGLWGQLEPYERDPCRSEEHTSELQSPR